MNAGAAERVTVWSTAACVHTGCDELPERVVAYAVKRALCRNFGQPVLTTLRQPFRVDLLIVVHLELVRPLMLSTCTCISHSTIYELRATADSVQRPDRQRGNCTGTLKSGQTFDRNETRRIRITGTGFQSPAVGQRRPGLHAVNHSDFSAVVCKHIRRANSSAPHLHDKTLNTCVLSGGIARGPGNVCPVANYCRKQVRIPHLFEPDLWVPSWSTAGTAHFQFCRGMHLRLQTLGPVYRIVCRDGMTLLACL